MKRIVCFGDSNVYGYDPRSWLGDRYPEDVRWTGRLKTAGWTIQNEGFNGQEIPTSQWEQDHWCQRLLRFGAPDWALVMLGGNDLKRKFGYASIDIAGEMQILLEKIQSYNRFRMGDKMKVLLMAPPVIGEEVSDPWLEDCFDFPRARKISRELAGWYVQLAEMYGCLYLDAAQVVRASTIDGVHLEAESHARLARAVYQKLKDEKIVL